MQIFFFIALAFTSEITLENRLLHQNDLLPLIDDCEIKPANPLLCQSSIGNIANPEDETVLTDDSDSDENEKVEVQLPQSFDEVKIQFLKTMPPHAMILHRDSSDPDSNLFELHVTKNEMGVRRIDKDHSNSEVWFKPSCPTVFSHIVRWLTTFNVSDQMEMKLKHRITRSQAMHLANKCNKEPFHYLALFGSSNCYKFARTYCDELKAIDDFKSLENLKQESEDLQKNDKERDDIERSKSDEETLENENVSEGESGEKVEIMKVPDSGEVNLRMINVAQSTVAKRKKVRATIV